MKFTCTRELLDRQLQYVSRVVTMRSTVPILSNLLLETDGSTLRISGTDLELAMATVVEAQVEQEGSFTVPAKLFQEFVHQNPDKEITFHLRSHELVCTSAKVEATIPGIDAEEYPALPQVKETSQVSMAAGPLVAALKQVVIACAQDPGRPVLTGVYCLLEKEGTVLAATDSFRLVERRLAGVPVAEKVEMLIPMRTVQELIRIVGQLGIEDEIVFSISEQQLVLRLKDVELYSRLLSGIFPKYQAIVPQSFMATGELASSDYLQALRLAGIFSQSGIANVVMEITEEGILKMSSHGSQKGAASHTLPITLEEGFKPHRVALNTRFLQDAVSAAGAERITLKFSGPTSPLVISTGDSDYLQLVMPIRLDS